MVLAGFSFGSKEAAGLFGLAVAAIQYVPYCWSIYIGRIRPHVFSYIIWALVAGIVGVAQILDDAGPGAWVTLFSTVACIGVALLSMRRGLGYITKGDATALVIALASIPLWIITKNPLSAVLINTFIDMTAYWPTFRKAWTQPQEDSAQQYAIGELKHVLSLVALTNYDVTTTITSGMIVLANTLTIVLLHYRRAVLHRKAHHVQPDQTL